MPVYERKSGNVVSPNLPTKEERPRVYIRKSQRTTLPEFPVDMNIPADPGEMSARQPISEDSFFTKDRPLLRKAGQVVEKVGGVSKKGLFKGLGVLSWPFERIGYTLGTPLTEMLNIAGEQVHGVPTVTDQGLKYVMPEMDIKRLGQNIVRTGKAVGTGLKSWGTFKKPPEGVHGLIDTAGAYWEAQTGTPAPNWYKYPVGISASWLVEPAGVARILKGFKGAAKLTGLPQKLQAARIPEWQRAKYAARVETGAKITEAERLGKSLSGKGIKKIAKQLSEQSDKTITPTAVKQRLGQIIKGGITAEPGKTVLTPEQIAKISKKTGIAPELFKRTPEPAGILAQKANPVIQGFDDAADALKNLKILPKETYLTKLPKAKIAILGRQKNILQSKLTKLQTEVPYKEQLINKISKLTPDTVKQKRLADKLVDIAIKAEERGAKVADVGNEFISAAVEITTGSPLSKKIATLMDFMPGDKRLTILGNKILSLEKMGRVARNKEANNILNIAAKINPKVSKYVNQTVTDILNVATKIEDSKVMGQWPLMKYAEKMQYRFPGKASRIEKLTEKVAEIDSTIWKSKMAGSEKYMPRMYTSKEIELAKKKGFFGWAKARIRAKYVKQRQDIPLEVRRQMGEFREPAYPVMKRLVQEGVDIETGRLFKLAADNPQWSGTSKVWTEGLSKTPLADSKTLGALRGMYVKPRVYSDITEMERIRGSVEKLYDTVIGSWKLGKVVLNPATHFRNKVSNKILLDLSGMDYGQQVKYSVRAFNEYRKNTEDYQFAKKYFARTTMIKGEIMDDLLRTNMNAQGTSGTQKIFNTVRGGAKKILQKPADMYQHEEFINKFMKYLQQRDMGKSVIEAVEEANKWLFDYGELSVFEKNVMRRIMPFYTFQRKAIPRVIEAMAERPYVVAKYPMAIKAMTQYSLARLNITDKDYAQIQEDLPDYMKNGSYMLMPYRDDNGDLRFFDWTYMLPWGDIAEAQERGVLKSVVTNPVFGIVSDVMHNKSSWTEKEIWKETDTPEEKFVKKVQYFWENVSPALAPKGIYWNKLEDAARGTPSKYGKKPLVPETVAHTIFGLRTQAIDPKKQKMFKELKRQRQLKEIMGGIKDIAIRRKNKNITEKEYQKRLAQYKKQLKKYAIE